MVSASSSIDGKTVLVTGGAGFIGSHLVEELMKRGCDMRVLDDFSSGKPENLSSLRKDAIIKGDVTDLVKVEMVMKDVDIVFHEAAQTSVQRSIREPILTNQANVIGTLHVLMAARKAGVKKVILASSAAVYGDPGKPCVESMQPVPLSPYAASKASAEAYCMMYYHLYGMATVCLRYFNVYGPRQDPASEYASVIPRFAACFAAGKRPTVFGDGRQSRDFVFISDVVKANMLAAERDVSGECINIASGTRVTVSELVKAFRDVTGKQLEPEHAPPRPGDIQHSVADIRKAKKLLGFSPAISLYDGLRQTMENNIS